VGCVQCHADSGPPTFNPYGQDVSDALAEGDFEAALPDALRAVEALDSDGDGQRNLQEIMAGGQAGAGDAVEPECGDQGDAENPWYDLGVYDTGFAWRRVMHDFCGRRPRYEELLDHRAATEAGEDAGAAIAELLDACLASPYWAEVLQEIGVGVIQPAGQAVDANILGNWAWDLRLFVWATSGGRDAGDLLAADYLVVEEPAGSGLLAAIDAPRDAGEEYAQPLSAEHRYGLITTRYSLAMRVMFSPVPRNLAAHYYRELLGLDLARSEGLYPVDEAGGAYAWDAPADVDDKGVWQEGCAGCHSTLDPLAYPWVRYNGIDLSGDTTAAWIEGRGAEILPTTDGWLLGAPVGGPEAWVAAAVASDAFARRVVELFWTYLLQRAPYSCEREVFDDLWRDLRDGGRDVEAMLHALVATEAYGRP